MYFENKEFGINFTPGAINKGIEKNELRTKQDYSDFLQNIINQENIIYAIHDFDKNERQEIRLILEKENICLFCSTTNGGKLLQCFSVIRNVLSSNVYDTYYKLACKFRICLEPNKAVQLHDAKELRDFLKKDFENRRIKENINLEEQRKKELEIRYKELVYPNNFLNCKDISDIFEYVIENARSHVYIICPWIKYTAIAKYKDSMQASLDRGLSIHISYGIEARNNEAMKDNARENDGIDEESKGLLESMKKIYNNLKTSDNNNDHSKILIWNDEHAEWMLVGSFNFLSFYLKDEKIFRNESALLTDSTSAIKKCKHFYSL